MELVSVSRYRHIVGIGAAPGSEISVSFQANSYHDRIQPRVTNQT